MPMTLSDSTHQSPRVSVLMRTRNRPVLLARAVASVHNQTFTDYELIIVNDAGERRSVEHVIASLPDVERRRTRFIHKEESTGMEAATNTAFAASRGEFIAILDDDDTWDPEFLQTTVSHLDAHPEQVAVATRADVVVESLDDEGRPTELERQPFAAQWSSWNLVDILAKNYIPINSELVRADAARRAGGWDESLQTQGDWDFSLRLLSLGPSGFIAGEPLAHWHHRRSATGDAGNSIFVAAQSHLADNMSVRDRYLRETVSRADGSPDLGLALQVASYYQRLLDESRREADSLHEALARISAHLESRIDALEEATNRSAEESRASAEESRTSLEGVHTRLTDLGGAIAALNDTVASLAPRSIFKRAFQSLPRPWRR